jgi:hypothetical protein
MCQIAGGALGLASITALFTAVSEDELTDRASAAGTDLSGHQQAVLHGLLTGTDAATSALAELSSRTQQEIEQIVRDSFVTGLQTSFKVVAAIAVIGFVISVVFVGGRLGADEDPGEPVE